MNVVNLQRSLPAILVAAALYTPAGHAIVRYNTVKDALDAGVPAVAVTYADLDLDRGTGAETLYQRLRAAAKKVCGAVDGRNLTAVQQQRRCFNDALDRAVAAVDNDLVSRLHGG
jgi:UrcA family protein